MSEILLKLFSLPCDKRLTLYSPRLVGLVVSQLFRQLLNTVRQLIIFRCPTQLKPQICYFFNSLMKSCHSNKKTYFGNSHVTDDLITLDVTWEDILWQMLSCDGLTVFYYISVNCVQIFKIE